MKDSKLFKEAIEKNGKQNLGMFTNRLEFDKDDLENSFSRNWKLEQNRTNINYGHGILQDLFILPSKKMYMNGEPLTKITDRDRLVSATVVQWLGTNCGLCFLRETLEEAGYKIVKK
jgi:hypothetical protein